MNGFENTFPLIRLLKFSKDTIELVLADGRTITAPLNRFPGIKKLSPSQRKKYHIMGGVGFDFDDSDEVYHISEFLGKDNSLLSLEQSIKTYSPSNRLTAFAEPATRYRKRKAKP